VESLWSMGRGRRALITVSSTAGEAARWSRKKEISRGQDVCGGGPLIPKAICDPGRGGEEKEVYELSFGPMKCREKGR